MKTVKEIAKKSWVGELDNSYHQAIDSAIETLKDSEPKTTIRTVVEKVNVAGFEVEVEKKIEEETKDVGKELIQQKNEIESFRQSLSKKGINPLAVVPKKIFEKMIEGLPFYTFKNINEKGEVKADVNTAGEKRELIDEDGSARYFIFSSIVFFIVGIILGFTESHLFFIMPVSFAMFIAAVVITVVYVNDESKIEKIKRILIATLGTLSSPIFGLTHVLPKIFFFNPKKYLWPNKTDEGIYGDWIKIILPKPSKEVNDRLLICHKEGVKTYLVVHEKGFGVSSDEISQKYRENYDPLVVTESDDGKYIAVIAQVGEIPEEKKLIKRIKEGFKSLPEELERLVFLN